MRERQVVLLTTTRSLRPATLRLATRLARESRAVLQFLHVEPQPDLDAIDLLHRAADAWDDRADDWLADRVPTDPGVAYRHVLRLGDPVAVVHAELDRSPPEYLVVEEPARAWLTRTLCRSLAQRLGAVAPCPVVVAGPGLREAPRRPRAPAPPAARGELLNAAVDARVRALRTWMDHQADAAVRISHTRAVRAAVARGADREGRLRRVRFALDEHRRALGAAAWGLRGPDGWAIHQPLELQPSPELEAFEARVLARGASCSLPMAVEGDDAGLVVLAGARVPGGGDAGLLVLAFDAHDHFLRILGQPGPDPSFETYAFDRTGLMLSNSRFPDDLRAAGLLPEHPCAQTPLRLRVAEPTGGPMESWPLTRMAARATRQQSGFDVRGYPDYRGTQVIGAWRWVEDYGFGVTAEVDKLPRTA